MESNLSRDQLHLFLQKAVWSGATAEPVVEGQRLALPSALVGLV